MITQNSSFLTRIQIHQIIKINRWRIIRFLFFLLKQTRRTRCAWILVHNSLPISNSLECTLIFEHHIQISLRITTPHNSHRFSFYHTQITQHICIHWIRFEHFLSNQTNQLHSFKIIRASSKQPAFSSIIAQARKWATSVLFYNSYSQSTLQMFSNSSVNYEDCFWTHYSRSNALYFSHPIHNTLFVIPPLDHWFTTNKLCLKRKARTRRFSFHIHFSSIFINRSIQQIWIWILRKRTRLERKRWCYLEYWRSVYTMINISIHILLILWVSAFTDWINSLDFWIVLNMRIKWN